MKLKFTLFFTALILSSFQIAKKTLPNGFVYVKEVITDIDVELRYFTDNNFVGDTITDYNKNELILTKPAAVALREVQNQLMQQNLCLRIYDGYRPQGAVNHFIKWARKLDDTLMKQQFYPEVKKRNLFNSGYIASRSGHSRGSTVDLTIIDAATGKPLDMGSPYDFFGEVSWIEHKGISDAQRKNRQLLQKVMAKNGFRNYPKEWWHFTLRNEPFPGTYFDFPIE
ncbi:D-Ala-D-Ala dipeptidase vanX. Metallo peptidase. MEROPS family M15D [Flavobacteriaceae bacterium MAR_2010_188]|nr:D-Ala-D-Ala dipeptidase vanX. Metallo peptidase. MEROPS family M15D [Flavobacteriaceae bacterium MAR_2010_188]